MLLKLLLIRSRKEIISVPWFCLGTFSLLWCLLSLHFHVWPSLLLLLLALPLFISQHKLQMHKIWNVCLVSNSSPISVVFWQLWLNPSYYVRTSHFFTPTVMLKSFCSSFPSSLSSFSVILLLSLLSFVPSDNPVLPSFLLSLPIFPHLSLSQPLYHFPSHIMLAWLMAWRCAYWIVIRVSRMWAEGTWERGGWRWSCRGDSIAGSGRWMERIRGLTDKANGNKWLPC